LQPVIEQAVADLAQRLSMAAEEILVLRAEMVTWPDASLGCPQPGMKYKQVPEDGALIVLQAMGMVYEYHLGGSRGLFLCEQIHKDPTQPPLIDITRLTPQNPDNSTPPAVTPDKGIPPGGDK
jgi:hypothetical protein